MQKLLKILISASCFLILLHSCIPDPIEITVPQLEPKPVVFTQVIPQQFMIVLLTQSISALEFTSTEIDTLQGTAQDSATRAMLQQVILDSAVITISYLGFTDTLFEVPDGNGAGTGFYISAGTLQFPGEQYTLDIYTTKGEHVTAMAIMHPRVSFSNITPIIEINGNDTVVKIAYEINDPAGANWYMLNVYAQGSLDSSSLELNDYLAGVTDELRKSIILPDVNFSVNGAATVYRDTFVVPGTRATDTIAVTFSNIDSKYYDYLALRQQSSNWFSELTKEPINYPTNVMGGYGFFLTHNPDIRLFDLNDY